MLTELLVLLGLKKINDGFDALSTLSEDKEYGIYYDKRGTPRWSKNAREVIRAWDHGDMVFKDLKNGKIYVNVTLIDAKKREDEAKKNGDKFYLRQVDGWDYQKIEDNSISGDRYCEIGNPNIFYVKRRMSYKNKYFTYFGEYYMCISGKDKYKIYCPTEKTERDDLLRFGNQTDEFHKLINILFDYNCNKLNWWKKSLNNTTTHDLGEPIGYKTAHKKISRWR